MSYAILRGWDPEKLVIAVAQHLANGWRLQGGIAIAAVSFIEGEKAVTKAYYAQAIVKEKHEG